MSKKYGLLVRISRDEEKKKAVNLDAQVARLKEVIRQRKDGEIVRTYRGLGHSASFNEDTLEVIYNVDPKGNFIKGLFNLKKRNELKEALDDAKAGKITNLIFTKWDRFARNVPFKYLCQIAFEKYGVTIEAADEENRPLVVNILMNVAEEEIRKNREKSADQFEYKFNLGIHPFRSIFGYQGVKRIIRGKNFTVMEIVPWQAEIVREVFKLKDVREICEKFGINSATYYNIISNEEIYKGNIVYKNRIRKGIHQAILSTDQKDTNEKVSSTNNNGSDKEEMSL